MEYIIKDREPKSFFRYFEEISAIPRKSFHEDKIADYIVDFAKARGLEYYRDEHHNVLVKMPATKGQEHREPILFQGHTDMVCEKESGVEHDFMTDPLDLYIDGKYLKARGTTLGADDGVGVATMLALLDGEIAEHPAYECLFTTAEEAGLVGAPKFDFSRITSRKLINLDVGLEKYPVVSCSGALRTRIILPYKTEPVTMPTISVSISGLFGGHPGVHMKTGRENANKLMGRLIAALMPLGEVRIVSVNTGSKDNGIPRDCVAILAVPNADEAKAIIMDYAAAIATELVEDDKNFKVTVEPAEANEMMSREDTAKVCGVLACIGSGLFAMCRDLTYLPETSRNFAIVSTEDGNVVFWFATRSARNSKLDAAKNELDAFAAMIGATTDHYGRYPGWIYDPDSELRKKYAIAYKEVTGDDAIPVGVHTGIECGVIRYAVPDMDAIALGADHPNGHSPQEMLNLDSCENFWRVLRRFVEII